MGSKFSIAILRAAGVALTCAALSACAAKPVTSIVMAQPGDEALDCAALKQQIADNTIAEAKFNRRDKQTEAGNTVKTVASAIPVAGILAVGSTDLSNEDQVKARSLADRNEYLNYLAKQKGCAP